MISGDEMREAALKMKKAGVSGDDAASALVPLSSGDTVGVYESMIEAGYTDVLNHLRNGPAFEWTDYIPLIDHGNHVLKFMFENGPGWTRMKEYLRKDGFDRETIEAIEKQIDAII
jgi:hypothetical protein